MRELLNALFCRRLGLLICAVVVIAAFAIGYGGFFSTAVSSASDEGAESVKNLVPAITASLADSFSDSDMDGKAAPGEVVTYTATISNGGTDATGVQFSDTLDSAATLVPGSFHASPVAVDNSYSAVGNTLLEVGVAASGFPAVKVSGSVLANDTAVTDTFSVVSNTTPTNGSLTFNANGTFSYLPNVNFTGLDTFTYTIRNAAEPTLTDTATVNINVSNKVWYVNNSGTNGTGRSNSPFNSLTSANTASGTGDTIFIHQTGTNYNPGISLKNNQQLIGQGVNLVVGGITLATATAKPVIAPGSSNGINLASGNTIRGLTVGNTGSGIGMSGSSVGSLTVSDTMINGTGEAIDINGGTLNVTFESISSTNSGSQGIDLNNVSGSFQVTGGTTITNSASTGVDLTGSGTGTFTFADLDITTANTTGLFANSGTINSTSGTISTGSGRGVDINGATLGITFTSISVNGGTAPGIDLESTSGTFTVTGNGSTSTRGGNGTGGTLQNMLADGVRLNTTGGLVTLQNMTIQDIGNMAGPIDTFSGHDGIDGVNVNGGLTLKNVTIDNTSDCSINGEAFSGAARPHLTSWVGLQIRDSVITDSNRWHLPNIADQGGQGNDTLDENMVKIHGISGTVFVDNTRFERGLNLLQLISAASGSLDVTIQRSEFNRSVKEFTSGPTWAVGMTGIDIIVIDAADAVVRIGDPNETNSFFGNSFLNDLSASLIVRHSGIPFGSGTPTGSVKTVISQNDFVVDDHLTDNQGAGSFAFGFPQGGVLLSPSGGTYEAIVSNNLFDEVMHSAGGLAQLTLLHNGGNGHSEFIVKGNEFKLPWDATVVVQADANNRMDVLFENNTYTDGVVGGPGDDLNAQYQSPFQGFLVYVRNGGEMDLTLRNEILPQQDDINGGGDFTFIANVQNTSTNDLNLYLDNNKAPDGYRFMRSDGTFQLYRENIADVTPVNIVRNNGNTGGGGVSGVPNPSVNGDNNPAVVSADAGVVATDTAPTLPSISIPLAAMETQEILGKRQNQSGNTMKGPFEKTSFGEWLKKSLLENRTADTLNSSLLDFSKTYETLGVALVPVETSPSIFRSLWDITESLASLIIPTSYAEELEAIGSRTGSTNPLAGETVTSGTFDLPAGKGVTLVFQATVDDPNMATSMTTQGTVTGTNFTTVMTDDPGVGGTNDPTVTPLLMSPTAAGVTLTGRAISKSGRGLENVRVLIIGGDLTEPRYTQTNPFGYFRFTDIPAGNDYVITVSSKRYEFAFPTRLVSAQEDTVLPVFVGTP